MPLPEASGTDIKRDIVRRRLQRIATEGFAMGHPVPQTRQVPLVPFDRPPFVICEVKRKSPSKGVIAGDLDAVAQARRYVDAGVKTISVLTEEDQFGGSLADLMAVKNAFPDIAVLRKDFLVRKEDVDVTYRAGADAVLLIASLLEPTELADLKTHAERLGLAVFVEVHDEADCTKARTLAPAFTGINCRDLTDFRIDRAIPLRTRRFVDWPTRLVYESGIFRAEEAQWAGASGFQGVLVGEGAVRRPELAAELVQQFRPTPGLSFWAKLYGHSPGGVARATPNRPYVKICGLTRAEDVLLADALGTDLVGFIFAEGSKRRVTPEFVRSLPPTRALKVGVVQIAPGQGVPDEIAELVDEGFLDALQFHGEEDAELVDAWSTHGYKAVGLAGEASWSRWGQTSAPRILMDAATIGSSGTRVSGGTGQTVAEAELAALASTPFGGSRLWLAGGLSPENIAAVVTRWKPELVDASSGLESSPGVKDAAKMKRYFAAIDGASR
ncbi:MAG: bifunctional indole-3-glycerol phosphate synthase/phosphoribosylanthranilate isomerase [Spirochaetales bacterium]